MGRFLGDARDLIAIARPTRVLEVGCGPGDLVLHLFGPGGGAGDTVDYVERLLRRHRPEIQRFLSEWLGDEGKAA